MLLQRILIPVIVLGMSLTLNVNRVFAQLSAIDIISN